MGELPNLISQLYELVDQLELMFPGRLFTPDGHMVGSLGEALADPKAGRPTRVGFLAGSERDAKEPFDFPVAAHRYVDKGDL
jgi:hypothetical protein